MGNNGTYESNGEFNRILHGWRNNAIRMGRNIINEIGVTMCIAMA